MGVKLASVEVKNYRSIFDVREAGSKLTDGRLELQLSGGINALVAPNNVGKSNVLRAVELAMAPKNPGFSKDRDSPKPFLWSRPSITLEFRLEDPLSTPERTLLARAHAYEESVAGIGSRPTFASRRRIRLRVKYQGDTRQEFIASPLGDRLGDPVLSQRVLDQLNKCIRFVLIRSGESLEDFLTGRFREVLRSVLVDAFAQSVTDAEQLRTGYVEALRRSLLGTLEEHLTVELREIAPEIGSVLLTPEVPDLGVTVVGADIRLQDVAETDLEGKGTGIRGGLLVAMLRYLAAHSKRSLVFAVEEPESFLHPQAQLELRRDLEQLAKRPDATLIVTTHSPFLLSRRPDAKVFRLDKRADGGTTLLAEAAGDGSSADIVAGLFGNSLVPRALEEVYLGDDCRGILIVEGETDATYLREACSRHSKDDLLAGVHIVIGDGAMGAMVEAVNWRRRGTVPVVVLLDSDKHGKDARARLTGDFRFQGKDVLTYDLWVKRGQEGVEAEDLFPEQFLEDFVSAHGEHRVLAEKRRLGGRWHYGFTQSAKGLFAKQVEDRASDSDLRSFLRVLDEVTARFAAGTGQVP